MRPKSPNNSGPVEGVVFKGVGETTGSPPFVVFVFFTGVGVALATVLVGTVNSFPSQYCSVVMPPP